MNVTVLFFATMRDAAGTRKVDFEIAENAPVGDLIASLGAAYPKVAPYLDTALVSVDKEYSPREKILPAGAEVAFFPPVSGG